MRYQFEWDPEKERVNIRNHSVSFRRAATVFQDPYQLSVYDLNHSTQEDRWITLGLDLNGVLRVVVHTYKEDSSGIRTIRIISARKATRNEMRDYERGVP